MHKLLWLLMLVLGMVAQAQHTSSVFSKHALGINISNDLSSQFTTATWYSGKPKVYYGSTLAIYYQYRPVQLFSVETGIEYNATKTRVEDGNPIGSNSFCCYDAILEIDFTQKINRFAMPVNLRLHWQKAKWSVYGLLGVALTNDFTQRFTFDEGLKEKQRLNEINTFNQNLGMALTVGAGIEYSVAPQLLLRMEPRFRVYDVVKQYNHNHYWAIGLNLGMYYRFGKE